MYSQTKIKNTMTLLTKKIQLNLLTGALEGGSNYWYSLDDLSMIPKKDYTPKTKEVREDMAVISGIHECLVSRIWEAVAEGKSIPVFDIEDEEEKLGEINLENLERGCRIMEEKQPEHFKDAISENDDAGTADVFFQFVVMGELVFG